MVQVGLVGCGTIGSRLALAIVRHYPKEARVVALHDQNASAAEKLRKRLPQHPPILSLRQLIQRSDLIIEAASAELSGSLAGQTLSAGKSVLVMSVGGLLMDSSWRRLAKRSKGHVYVPSGALSGLDGVRAMARAGIRRVMLTTKKPPQAFMSAPYVRQKRLRLAGLKRPKVIFQGSAQAVVRAFPQNTNVAAALTLASGLPAAKVQVRVVADPRLTRNTHEYTVEGKIGRLQSVIESVPSANPKTSELAIRSAQACLARLFETVTIGS